jgi:hypothetical protein
MPQGREKWEIVKKWPFGSRMSKGKAAGERGGRRAGAGREVLFRSGVKRRIPAIVAGDCRGRLTPGNRPREPERNRGDLPENK